jgi:hypothetical protein
VEDNAKFYDATTSEGYLDKIRCQIRQRYKSV